MAEFENADLGADVVDDRLVQQIKGRINEKLGNVKKGSIQYIDRELADQRRVKDHFYNHQKKQKEIM